MRAWDLRCAEAIARIRAADSAATRARISALRRVHLFSARCVRAFRRGHEALAVIFAEEDEAIPLHHCVMVLLTALLGMLCVQVIPSRSCYASTAIVIFCLPCWLLAVRFLAKK